MQKIILLTVNMAGPVELCRCKSPGSARRPDPKPISAPHVIEGVGIFEADYEPIEAAVKLEGCDVIHRGLEPWSVPGGS